MRVLPSGIGRMFSPDAPIMRGMSRIADLMILNLLFILTSVPIVTIGAASTAVYTVCFRFGSERESGVVRSYFAAFRDNFKTATTVWIMLLIVTAALILNGLYFFLQVSSWLFYLIILFAMLLIVDLLILSYAFPLLSQFENKSLGTIKNALFLSIGYLPRSILIAAINLLPWILLLFHPWTFLQFAFVWVAFYFGLAAFINTLILKRVFARYMPEEDSEEETEEETK